MPTAQPKAAQQVPARTAARQHHREAGGLSRLHERCEGEACRTSSAVCWAGLLHGTSSTSNAGSWAALAVVWAALRSSCDMSALMGGSWKMSVCKDSPQTCNHLAKLSPSPPTHARSPPNLQSPTQNMCRPKKETVRNKKDLVGGPR